MVDLAMIQYMAACVFADVRGCSAPFGGVLAPGALNRYSDTVIFALHRARNAVRRAGTRLFGPVAWTEWVAV
jgi:hypothetical protein